jgi:hypothetical protein
MAAGKCFAVMNRDARRDRGRGTVIDMPSGMAETGVS